VSKADEADLQTGRMVSLSGGLIGRTGR